MAMAYLDQKEKEKRITAPNIRFSSNSNVSVDIYMVSLLNSNISERAIAGAGLQTGNIVSIVCSDAKSLAAHCTECDQIHKPSR